MSDSPRTLATSAGDRERLPPEPASCDNCGASTGSRFCGECGQAQRPLREPIHHFVAESLVEYFGIDGRLWRSLGLLLFKPGRLTQAYFAGRRARYLRPLRMYLTATLGFFFLVALVDPVARLEKAVLEQTRDTGGRVEVADHIDAIARERAEKLGEIDSLVYRADSLAQRLEALRGVALRARSESEAVGAEARADVAVNAVDRSAIELTEDSRDGVLAELSRLRARERAEEKRRVLETAILKVLPSDSMVYLIDIHAARDQVFPDTTDRAEFGLPAWAVRSESVRQFETAPTMQGKLVGLFQFLRDATEQLPTAMFILLPVFALLLKGVYLRRGWYYSEHLVFALHTHAFAFIVFSIIAALVGFRGNAGGSGVAAAFLFLTIPAYFYLAQKRVYEQGWFKTALKAIILGGCYLALLLVGVLLLALLLAALLG